MTRLGVLNERLAGLQSAMIGFAREAMESREADIIDLQRTQLLAGKRADGEDIKPSYTEDLKANGGYFNSVDSAKAYAKWKEGLSYPKDVARNPLTPNLYINGRFHNELGVAFGEEEMAIIGTTAYAEGIMAKYPQGTFGLTDDSFATIKEDVTNDIREQVKQYLNG